MKLISRGEIARIKNRRLSLHSMPGAARLEAAFLRRRKWMLRVMMGLALVATFCMFYGVEIIAYYFS